MTAVCREIHREKKVMKNKWRNPNKFSKNRIVKIASAPKPPTAETCQFNTDQDNVKDATNISDANAAANLKIMVTRIDNQCKFWMATKPLEATEIF